MVHGYDYLAQIWLDGPLRLSDEALGAWSGELRLLDPTLAECCAQVVRLLDATVERDAAIEDYEECLVIPLRSSYVPPYASAWLDGSEGLWGPSTMGVLSRYQEAGLDWPGQQSDNGHAGEPPASGIIRPWVRAPDHLGVECAFVADLLAGEAEVDPGATSVSAALARGFVIDHLRVWVPAYADELARHARSRYWRGMAGVLEAWANNDAFLPVSGTCGSTGSMP